MVILKIADFESKLLLQLSEDITKLVSCQIRSVKRQSLETSGHFRLNMQAGLYCIKFER